MTAADFNHDGYDDLAIGAPGRSSTYQGHSYPQTGNVYVLFGSTRGLVTHGNYVARVSCHSCEHGYSLGAVDMLDPNGFSGGGDGYADLVIGGPGENQVTFRSGLDISALPNSYPEITLQPTLLNSDARFGAVVTGGFFTANGPEVAVGAPNADVFVNESFVSNAGLVIVIDKFLSSDYTYVQEDTFGGNPPETGDQFGAAIAAASTWDHPYDDLIVGVPGEDSTNGQGSHVTDAGAVWVMQTNFDGGFADPPFIIHQAQPSVPGDSANGDRFGASLAMEQLDAGNTWDYVVGIPGKKVHGSAGAGAVDVLFNDGRGLPKHSGNQTWTQDSPGVADSSESGDHVGASLTLGQFGHSNRLDLAVGVPGEDVAGRSDAGLVEVLYHASGAGFASAGGQLWGADSPGIAGSAHKGDRFGFALR